MRKITLTILFIVAVVAAWAQKPDKKTVKLEKRYDAPSLLIGFRVIAVRKKKFFCKDFRAVLSNVIKSQTVR